MQTKTTHTPGPWTLQEFEDQYDHFWSVAPTNKHLSAERIAQVLVTTDGYGEANANLIAAAPALLEALERLACIHYGANWLDGPDEGREGTASATFRQARAAVAQAKGEA